MSSHFKKILLTVLLPILGGCSSYEKIEHEKVSVTQEPISATAADKLINDGRAQIGLWGNQCKLWVQGLVPASYGISIPSTATNQFEWTTSSNVTNVAQWRGSYVNVRIGSTNTSLSAGQSITQTINIPNTDPQVIVIYASIGNIIATLTQGSTSLSATTPTTSPAKGQISGAASFASGNATFTVRNNSSTTASDIVAVALSKSRFQSDWESARRGDVIQMRIGTGSTSRSSNNPHTTFVQTDFNANGSTSCSGTPTSQTNTEGCNWLDSNWSDNNDEIVRAHNISMTDMMKMVAYSPDYGFTVYRLSGGNDGPITNYMYDNNAYTCSGPVTGGANTDWFYTCQNPKTAFTQGDTIYGLIRIDNPMTNHRFRVQVYKASVYQWEWITDWNDVGEWGWSKAFFWATYENAQPGSWSFRISVDDGNGFVLVDTLPFTVEEAPPYVYRGNPTTCRGPITGGESTNWYYTCENPTSTFSSGQTAYAMVCILDVRLDFRWKVEVYVNGVYQWQWTTDWNDVGEWGWDHACFWPSSGSVWPGLWEYVISADTGSGFHVVDYAFFTVN